MNTEEDQKRLDEAHDAIVRAGARCEENGALRAQLAASGKMAEDVGVRLQQALTEADALRERVRVLEPVYKAARGLCHGTDWNKGTHAIIHEYRAALIVAVNVVEELPPCSGVPEAKRVLAGSAVSS